MTIPDLIALLEAADGPDRKLDRLISVYDPGPKPEISSWNYTDSVDRAIALAEKVLPGMNCWGVEKDERGIEANVQRNGVKSGHWAYFAEHSTSAPIALVLATLRALEAKNG